MAEPDEEPSPEDETDDDSGRRKALAALLVVAALIGISLYVAHVLKTSSDLQDCAMQGRTNCAPIQTNSN
jgi:hypothetical protein